MYLFDYYYRQGRVPCVFPPTAMPFSTTIDIALAVAIPATAFALNWGMRAHNGYMRSAAADFILAIVAFDLSALFAHDVFEKAMHDATFKQYFMQIFGLLFMVTLVGWAMIFIPLEGALEKNYKASRRRKLTGKGQMIFFGSWSLVLCITAPHVFAFLYS
jgi:hypothetical protein